MDTTHRIFEPISHARFAQLSCDYNPMHMDAIAARRTQAGAPIVHGIHSLLWLLESIAESGTHLPRATSLKVQFRKPIYVGDEGSFEIVRLTAKAVRARVLIEGTEAVVASIGFGERQGAAPPPPLIETQAIPMTPPTSPNDLRLDEMEGRTGCLSFGSTLEQTEAMFPSAARYFGVQKVAALVCSSCLVGMVVPGLHSLFSGLEVSFFDDDAAAATDALQFAVMSVEPRFRLARIRIRGGGLQGFLETVSRLPPVMQPSMARIAKLVAKDEFRGCTALVVGGSRGLGELTAKLIAAGGGRVVITYVAGKSDADAVAEEIKKAGAECETAAYDVRQAADEQLAALGARVPTHVYYFATPAIFRRKAGLCDLRRFAELNSFYVAGFLDLVQACLRRRPVGIRVFYPSSVSIDTRPADMTEYAMSKAAAEILCADLQEYLTGVHLITRRLPRLPTDQTSSVAQVKTADPIAVLLPIVREMHSYYGPNTAPGS
jgi:NADP-dependent 3-hydroxy acid dehydrogenase YdfG